MGKKSYISFLFLSAIFIFTAYSIGVNQSALQLKQANERLASLEEQLKIQSMNEVENVEQLTPELTEDNNENQEIKQLKEKIRKLKAELSKSSSNKEPEKKVFLTFDDGPSPLTNEILDILKKKEVPATFFTIGNMMEQYPDIVKRTYDSGHMILPHSYSHKYSIYSTFDSFYEDLNKVEEVYKSILGFQAPSIVRFPGGSSNQTSIKYGGKDYMPNISADLRGRGYSYVDWNVISGDASPISKSPDQMLKQVISGSENNKFVVALFHDIAQNKATVKILPDVIDYYKKNGYTFRSFKDVTEIEMKELEKRGIVNKPVVR
ncbi:MAG: polysaccharide deacetylase family protein [Anaerobacillus sp.]|uniref:polysaccharide deacetylase family protein n=1 Tax=Anaerobacillus sp. TaxID=1872506 RepID=UPI003918C1AC